MPRKGCDDDIRDHLMYDDDDDDYDDDKEYSEQLPPAKIHQLRLRVPPEAVPHCIGKGHATQASIEARHACKIAFGPGEGEVVISGTLLDSLNRAKLDLMRIASSVEPAGARADAEVSVVLHGIPPGLAIGRGGENIRKAQSMLVRVDVLKDENAVRLSAANRAHLEHASTFYKGLLQSSFEKTVDVSPRVKREFGGICETMFGVLVRGAGQGAVTLKGTRDKVLAAEAYLAARERETSR